MNFADVHLITELHSPLRAVNVCFMLCFSGDFMVCGRKSISTSVLWGKGIYLHWGRGGRQGMILQPCLILSQVQMQKVLKGMSDDSPGSQ